MRTRGIGFWVLQGPGWLLFAYLVYAQGVAAINYDLGVAMGTQESASAISEVGTAFWYGFAFGDLVIYIPLLAAGLVGNWLRRSWSRVVLAAALGITVYWPIVCLAAVVEARDADGWVLASEADYWLVLPAIAIWGVWGLWWAIQSGADVRDAESD
ncbi:MAG: hypothetical protein ACR2QQ_12670 [Gammaproteobacteria bacterium]